MPELPEVQTVVNTLVPVAVGATISAIAIRKPVYIEPANIDLAAHLVGRQIASIHRRAKRILVSLDGGDRLLMHLGMTGRITVEAPGTAPLRHTHFIISVSRNGSSAELHMHDPRRFGGVTWLGQASGEDGLGPEPLTITAKQLEAILAATDRPIKALLLDQARIAGLGNIYADESLFVAGIHPLTPASRVRGERAAALCRAIKQVLRRAIQHGGSTVRNYVDARGSKGSFQKLHNVYDRAGEPCRACGAAIQRIVLIGRSTCFCPRCQRPPRLKTHRA